MNLLTIIRKAGTLIGRRRTINLIEGSNVTLTVQDDSVNDRVNVTIAASGGSGSSLSGTSVLNFGHEKDTSINTILHASITSANIKSFSIIPIETTETSLDDFKLNGVTFNIENIIDNTSFDIRGTASKKATGNYTITYKIIY